MQLLAQVRHVVWGRSSVWLEHSTVTREVAGSSPVAPVVSRIFGMLVLVVFPRTQLLCCRCCTPSWWNW